MTDEEKQHSKRWPTLVKFYDEMGCSDCYATGVCDVCQGSGAVSNNDYCWQCKGHKYCTTCDGSGAVLYLVTARPLWESQ